MTKAQALKLARAKWGQCAALRHNPRAGTAETREAARVALRESLLNKPTDRDALFEWRKMREPLVSAANSYRFEVGQIFETPFGNGVGIRGGGDSWEEACRKAGLLP